MGKCRRTAFKAKNSEIQFRQTDEQIVNFFVKKKKLPQHFLKRTQAKIRKIMNKLTMQTVFKRSHYFQAQLRSRKL